VATNLHQSSNAAGCYGFDVGSCLISSANFFVFPLWTAANMIPNLLLQIEKKEKEAMGQQEKLFPN